MKQSLACGEGKETRKFLGLTFLVTILMIPLWRFLPQSDFSWYFDFANSEMLAGIPNFLNVISNLPFIIVSILGWAWIAQANTRARIPTEMVFIGRILCGFVFLVAIGSSYFHLIPNETTIFWDRIPITFSMFGIIGLLVADRLSPRLGKMTFIFSAIALMALLLLFNYGFLTFRIYSIIQLGGVVLILLLNYLTAEKWIDRAIINWTFGLYLLAKIFEMADTLIFDATGFIGGHPIKHVIAALALLKLFSFFKQEKLQ